MQDFLSSIPWQPIWASIQRGMATVAAQSGVLAGLSLVVALVAAWRAAAAHRRLRSLERWLRAPGHDGVAATRQPDEPTLGDVLARLHRLEVAQDDTGRRVATMAEELARCVRHVAVVRFNAFPNMGGEQSFALALLDAEGNGAVITTLAGREDTRTYAKPITAGSSPYLLSEEEREAIRRAMADEAAGTGPVAGREGRRR
ncbi:hypothetical protein Tmar_2365 [Thermaerobacter marianensis DSM 12885]|uniref:DUF4446 domain-containing protein n=1 Tax=Thermaerobacter marianensis (strain ATCC 700841 / DSM 12885 / JCM 10246 / 7p75a) TaxID=644966 RepID=E6SLY4_THEM7|nr:DUF4446 family protein [Thermaerobacter marianensis]ADU52442.1 hypothetical protein Tmar_2365 [Thermaerobacter marianensis DSM 12885]